MILFSNVFKKSGLVEPDCLNRIFLVPPSVLLVFQVISDVHPWDTLEQRAHRRCMAEKKVGRTCCFDFRSRFVVLTVAFAGHVGNAISYHFV